MIYTVTTPDGKEHHARGVAELRELEARLLAEYGPVDVAIRSAPAPSIARAA